MYLEPKSSAPCGRFSEMKAGIAKERTARLLRFPGWESRTLPDSTKKSLRRCLGLFLCASRQVLLPGRFQANVQHCTWLGSPMCAAGGGSSTWGNTWESRGKARKKLCASVTSISPVVFNECATLYLVRIFSAARCAGFRQENFPSPRQRITSKHMSK